MPNLLVEFGNKRDLVSGSHFICFYSQEIHLINILDSLISAGLASEEKTFILADEMFVSKVNQRANLLDKKFSDEEEQEFKVRPVSESLVFHTNKQELFSNYGLDWNKLFTLLESFIQNAGAQDFKSTRIIIQLDWLIDLARGLDNLFLYKKKIFEFLRDNFNRCIMIDCFNSNYTSGGDLLKIITYYDGFLFESLSKMEYFTNSKELALTDMLTGLYNGRYLQARIREEIFRAKRYRGSCSLISIRLFDINAVKATYGVDRINKIYIDFSEILVSNLRKVDLIAFYNEDCFGVLMPETSKKRSFMIAERIRKVFDDRLVTSSLYEGVELELKAGISNFPIDTRKANELILFANEALKNAMVKDGHVISTIDKEESLFPPLD